MSALASVTTHRELVENLIIRDFKARYKQSTLGFAWAILTPFVTSLIITLVGNKFLQQDTKIPFPVFAFYGVLFWSLFQSGLLASTESLVSHLNLITKIYFPREVFPLSAVLSKLIDFGFGLIGLIPLLLYFQLPVSPMMLLILPLLLIQMLFTLGLGMLCACANLFYRDVRYVVGLILAMWWYLVPNLYPLERVPERWHWLYLLNPMATIIESARRLTFPQTGLSVPWGHVGVAAALSVVVFVVGFTVFKRFEGRFAEFV